MKNRSLAVVLAFGVLLILLTSLGHSASIIKGKTWFPIGPAPIDPTVFGGVAAGRASVLAVNPDNPDDVFLGAATGGVWHTLDAGLSWSPISDDTQALAIGAIALDPALCNAGGCDKVYVGTGENNLRRDTFYGRGLLVGFPEPGAFQDWAWDLRGESIFSLSSINNVVLDPTTAGSTKRIYVTASSGVTASASQSTVTAPAPGMGFGIYKSEDDGNNWVKLSVPLADGAKPTDLEMDPLDSDLLFAGFLGRGIFKGVRDPMTGIIAWCPLNPGNGGPTCPGTSGSLPNAMGSPFDRVEIEIHHTGGPDPVLYATFGTCTDPICTGCLPTLHKSVDGGMTWTLQNPAAPFSYSRYTHALAIHPSDHTRILYGGLGMFRSTVSGVNFDSFGDLTDDDIIAQPPPNQLHPDQQEIVFADPAAACTFQPCNIPGNNCVLYAVNDGGFYRSTDSGCSWRARMDGLQITGFQSIGASPLTPVVLGGTQDNGTVSFTGASAWEYETGGDTTGTVIDLDSANKMYSVTLASCGPERLVSRSIDGGMNWISSLTTPMGEQASFYPPLVQDPFGTHPLYFATNVLYRSDTDGASWSDVSPSGPPLGGDMVFFPDIQRTNVITAIGVAPGHAGRVYVGHYDGQVWMTDSACNTLGCWTDVSGAMHGLPENVPVTWIAVDPTDENVAYLTLSGFFSGPHVYKTTTGGAMWFAASGAGMTMLPDVPASTIAIEPSEPMNVWVGTDSSPDPHRASIFKSTDGGMSWLKFNDGMPNVPIFHLEILERIINPQKKFGQIYAATHGRGAFVLTQPFITNFEGWVNDSIWDIPVYGNGYPKNQMTCTMQILQSNGTICAQATVDARGGTMKTGPSGQLKATSPDYMGQDVLWACFNGSCIDGTPIAQCNDDETGDGVPDPLTTVLVECGGVVGIDAVTGCPQQNNPPGNVLSLNTVIGPGVATAASPAPALVLTNTMQVMPVIQRGDGNTEVLCDVGVMFDPAEPAADILHRAMTNLNADAACIAGGVVADLTGNAPPDDSLPGEDHPQDGAGLFVSAPNLVGGQMFTGVRLPAGQGVNPCFNIREIGIKNLGQLLISRLKFTTPATGALGGTIAITEHSPLGLCRVEVPISPGLGAAEVRDAVHAALVPAGIQGGDECPSDRNPKDAVKQDESLIFTLATGLEICMNDSGVGFMVAPEEVCFTDSDCDDGNTCTQDLCDVESHKCKHDPLPDGTRCADGNLCTIGDFCFAGTCGEPVVCDDGKACTIDKCDPKSGECLSTGIICDDGNQCTADFCDERTGQCAVDPLVGAPCDDGDACTLDDRCAFDDVTGETVCQGPPQNCDDRNPCTVDSCDPLTGACFNAARDCDDGNQCTLDFCDTLTGECLHEPLAGEICDDGDSCTKDDTCIFDPDNNSAFCQGVETDCNDNNLCTFDVCDPQTGQCVNAPVVCDDNDPCTEDRCDPATGQCVFALVICDDGNQCTKDACDPQTGQCQFVPDPGSICDDGDLCTQGDICVQDATGSVSCAGQPIFCDDGDLCTQDFCNPNTGQCESTPTLCDDQNVCTADQCDPITGECLFTLIPLNEVKPIGFVDPVTLMWPPTPGATHWNTYKGRIPPALLGSRLPGSVYDHICYESDDAHGNGPTTAVDPAVPPLGTAWYYVVTEEGICGEGPICPDSSGATRPNASPCPTPP